MPPKNANRLLQNTCFKPKKLLKKHRLLQNPHVWSLKMQLEKHRKVATKHSCLEPKNPLEKS